MTNTTAAATRRLLRDLREWKSSQHLAKSITATPLDNDVFKWHVNFFPADGPLKGIIFHLIIKFPNNYPESPPKVSIENKLEHPNVFDGWICLNMLRPHQWCRAYSVSSILFQLLSFLVTNKAPQDYGPPVTIKYKQSEIDKMRTKSIAFACKICGHKYKKPYPPLSHELLINNRKKTKRKKKYSSNHKKTIKPKSTVNYWDKTMSDDVEGIIVQFLNVSDLISFGRVNNRFKQLVKGFSKYILMTKFNCWYHRIDLRYSEHLRTLKPGIDNIARNVVLGYGINPEFYNNTIPSKSKVEYNKQKIPKYPPIKSCATLFHLISYDAYKNHSINCTPTKDKTFTAWIPMYVLHKRYHGKKALKMIKQATLDVFSMSTEFVNKTYHPIMSIELITSIMSSLVVVLMESLKSKQLHHSISVMDTYYHYFHLLLAVYYDNYKVLKEIINNKCLGFIYDINKRIKKTVPNLGYFMIWFLLFECPENISSSDIFKALLQESLVRHVKWLIKAHGQSYEAQTMQNFDIRQSFKGSLVANRLFMFQYFFMVKCCNVGIVSPKEKFNELNRNLGCVSEDITRKLQLFCQRKLRSVRCWSHFFKILNIQYPTKFGMQCWLRRSVFISAERRYHFYQRENLNANKDLKPLCEKLFFAAIQRNDIKTIKMLLNIDINENEQDAYNTDNECEEFDMKMTDEKDVEMGNYKYCIIKSTIGQYLKTKYSHNPDWDISRLTNYKKLLNNNNTPLFFAIQNNEPEMIELLISQGFDTTQFINMWDKLLVEAVGRNDIKIVKYCLGIEQEKDEQESDSDDSDKHIYHDTVQRAYQNLIDIMMLFDKYSDFGYVPNRNIKNSKGCPLISIAAKNCYAEMVKLLCDENFNVTMVDSDGKTALRYAQNGRNDDNKKEVNYIIKVIKKQKKKAKLNMDLKDNENDIVYNVYEIREAYEYGGDGFDIWITNDEKPIYSDTVLKCLKKFGGSKKQLKELLINVGYFDENTIKSIKYIAELPTDIKEINDEKIETKNTEKKNRKRNRNRERNKGKNNSENGINNNKKQSKSNKRNQRRKLNKKMNKYWLIRISDKMDEIYDSMYRINSKEKNNIIEIYIDKNTENDMKENRENCILRIENFDILDKNCHKKLTQLLLRYGQLEEDIEIEIDEQNNPYCMVHFRNKNDAIGCKQARKLMFGEKVIKIRYSDQKCNVSYVTNAN